MDSECKGQLYGHDFPYPGANCTNCSVSQYALSGMAPRKIVVDNSLGGFLKKMAPVEAKPVKGIHSELHALVSEARHLFGETAKVGKGSFGFYLGFFKRIGIDRVRLIMSDIKEKGSPKKLFWWHVAQLKKKK